MPIITQKLGFDARGAMKTLDAFATKCDKGTAALAKFQQQAAQGGGLNPLNNNLNNTQKGVHGLIVSWQTLARIISTQFVVRGLASLLASIQDSTKAAHELALAVEEIQTISGRTQSSSAIQQGILDVSSAVGKSAQDISAAYYETISNQVVEVGEALNFTSEAAKLATLTSAETMDAVNALSSVMNSYGMEAEQANYVSDTLFKTVELGRLRLNEFANILGRVTPLTAQMGVSWEEAAAAIAVMTRQGVRADTAITQLRAVMTKMIKPTEEVSAMFRRWGVQDGKQAIETFGGLKGVLAKLNDEVGGSSAEMADLLRNVRAIVGEMGIMTDEGKELDETLKAIKESAGEVNKQWDLFAASDAQQLTIAMNEFKNTLISIGSDALPSLTSGMKWLNGFVSNVAMGFRVLSGEFDEAGIHAELMKRMAVSAGEEIRKKNEEFATKQREKYSELSGAASKYYTEIQIEENKLADIRDASIASATKAVTDQGKKIVDFYKQAADNLKKFVDGINDKIKSDTEKIAEINQEISERQLQSELDKWDNVYAKQRILEDALSKQRQKSNDALRDVDASDESVARALKENEIATSMAEQVKALAEQTGHRNSIQQAENTIQGLLQNRKAIYEEHRRQLEGTKGKLKEISDQMQADESKLQALQEQRKKLYESGDLDSDNKERQKNAEAILADLNRQIDEIVAGAGRHDAFLKSLGLETSMIEVSKGITEALNDAHKDWQEEVRLAKEAFANATIPLRAAIEGADTVGPAADALGIDLSKKGVAEGARAVDEGAVKAAEQLDSKLNDISNKQIEINGIMADTGVWLDKAANTTLQELKATQAVSDMRVNVRNGISAATFGLIEGVDANERFAESLRKTHGAAIDTNTALREGVQSIREGKVLTDEEIAALREKIAVAQAAGQLDEGQVQDYNNVVGSIEQANIKLREQKAIKETLPDEAQQQALRDRVTYLEQAKQAEVDHNVAAEQTKQQILNAKAAYAELPGAIGQATTAQNGQTTAANSTVQATSAIGPTAAAQVGAVAALTQAYEALARAAAAAATAQASAGGAAQFHGGPMSRYFAAGGQLSRGQDKILTALTAGETVVNSKNSRRFFSELNAMNQGSQPVYREQGGPVTNVGDINVTVNGGDSSQQTVREIAHALRREVKRGNIKLR